MRRVDEKIVNKVKRIEFYKKFKEMPKSDEELEDFELWELR